MYGFDILEWGRLGRLAQMGQVSSTSQKGKPSRDDQYPKVVSKRR
jgi:hypothetical protein